MPGHWASSDRRSRLPADWPRRRAATQRRAGDQCQCQGACGNHIGRCTAHGTDCDHITANDDHSLANLQWLCRPCHQAKTKREAEAAARAARAALTHPAARLRHPGLR